MELNISLSLSRVSTFAHLPSYILQSYARATPIRNAVSSKLHISVPGIGVDGERGYNSSHCIGSSRVIGPLLVSSSSSISLPCSLTLCLSSLTILNYFCPSSYRISFSEDPMRANYCTSPTILGEILLSIVLPSVIELFLSFRVLSDAFWFKCV